MHRSYRREFLRFLAGSPLLATASAAQQPEKFEPAGPADILSVMDLEPLAKRALPPAHWGYLATGVNDDLTIQANRDAMSHFQLRARVLTGVKSADLSTEVFGTKWDMPVFLSPLAAHRAFHADAEPATARAAKAQRATMALSTMTSTAVEEVAKNLGAAPWYQMYMPKLWSDTEKVIARVEAVGCPVLIWTIDTMHGRNAETGTRFARIDARECMRCHVSHPITGDGVKRNRNKAMFTGLAGEMNPSEADWSYVGRLKKLTRMKIVLKGIDTAEDAKLAVENGADGIVVSNHGGRATETGRGTLDILPEVVDTVSGRIPVLIDGGFRRGTDVLKALALGARGVGIGRPYIWGLATYGQAGVERVLAILRAELALNMRQCGFANIAAINRSAVLKKS